MRWKGKREKREPEIEVFLLRRSPLTGHYYKRVGPVIHPTIRLICAAAAAAYSVSDRIN